jgi:glyoxylase-like metal-dependent hydrolase (beta-lactamase superfamily II)
LGELGVSPGELAGVAVTHIHLDHAGGVGDVASAFPDATVYVHEKGARHLADPTRLVDSAAMIYGPLLDSLYGRLAPTPADRLHVLDDGEEVDIGDGRTLTTVDSPGHAKHHLALHDSSTGILFVGDAVGVRLPDAGVLRPSTPPPDFDLERTIDSIERIRGRARSVLLFAHFGPIDEVDAVCDLAIRRVRDWADVVRETLDAGDDIDEVTARLERAALRDIETGSQAELDLQAVEARLELLSSIRMNAQGLVRYWKKRAEREAAAADARS